MQAKAVQGIAIGFFNIGQYEEALEYLKMFVELTGDLNDHGTEQALNQKRLGMCYIYLERFEESLVCFKKALQIIRDWSEKAQEAIISEWCGYCSRFIEGQRKEAIEFYEEAKNISKEVGEKYQEYRTNQAIGNILGDTGDYEGAKQYYEEAIEIATELHDRHRKGTSFLNLASVCHKSGDDDIAVKWYREALNVAKELDDHLLQEKCLTGQGIAWFYRGDAQQAIDMLRAARNSTEQESESGNLLESVVLNVKYTMYL